MRDGEKEKEKENEKVSERGRERRVFLRNAMNAAQVILHNSVMEFNISKQGIKRFFIEFY